MCTSNIYNKTSVQETYEGGITTDQTSLLWAEPSTVPDAEMVAVVKEGGAKTMV